MRSGHAFGDWPFSGEAGQPARKEHTMKPYKGHIENWYIQVRRDMLVIIGEIGEDYTRTSAIVMLTMNMVETQNSIYSLGKMVWPAP